jgi:uncharacterized protein
MKRITWLSIGCLALVTTTQAASFDCAKAQSKVEHLICSNSNLSKLDDELSAIYTKAIDIDENNDQLQSEQVNWLAHERNICKDIDCLEHTYKDRISILSKYVKSPHPPHSLLVFSTYLGGRGDDRVARIRVDMAGNSYIGGSTEAWDDFPVLNAGQPKRGGRKDGVVAKFSANGLLLWATHLGGAKSNFQFANFEASTEVTGLALAASDYLYVSGYTDAVDFPVVNASQATLRGSNSSFLVKFNGDGQIIWSTYVNGLYIRDIATDHDGAVYLAAYKMRPNKGGITVISKYDSSGKLLWEKEFGGAEYNTDAYSIALDTSDNVYVGGAAQIDILPNPGGAPQYAVGQFWNPFLAKFDPNGEVLWSTKIGGEKRDGISGIDVDRAGNVYVVGNTTSNKFPTLNAAQPHRSGNEDAFVAKFSTNGKLLWSTYLGSTGNDAASAVVVDPNGYVHVTGYTASTNFPTERSFQRLKAGLINAFFATYSNDGKLIGSSYLGGSATGYRTDGGVSVATDKDANVYITGSTGSDDFPIKNAYQSSFGGLDDIFVTKIDALK